MKRSIVWFKTDLRITDNETLAHAIAVSDEVIPLFILDERLLQEQSFGFRRIGPFRLKFLLESLKDLDRSLRIKGSGLLFRIGKQEEVVPQVAAQYHVNKVFAKKEVSIEEKTVHSQHNSSTGKDQ